MRRGGVPASELKVPSADVRGCKLGQLLIPKDGTDVVIDQIAVVRPGAVLNPLNVVGDRVGE
jgi:hypothetical protein